MTLKSSIAVNCNVLKVINCMIYNFDIFKNSNINKLIINEGLYLSNKELFDSLKCTIQIMADLGDTIVSVVNNNG